MGKSKGKWDIDWKKIGRNMGKVTEPDQGVGTGKSCRDETEETGGVRAARVSTPQRPMVPRERGAESEAQGGTAVMIADEGVEAEQRDEFESGEIDMDMVTKNEPVRVNDAGNVEPNRFAGNGGQESQGGSNAGGRDTESGMDLLSVDFMLGVVESTAGSDENDVVMRKLSFNELLRVGARGEIDSRALQVYAVDAAGLYGKDIQRQAMEELALRTGHSV
ncbi:hypothetical protein STSP2_02475 [Anaerohalosphaera lusitana]|uniref:Uncharacterized protein n=1 Tax=Anaerohalosphaera lusitana TaxID=1936003 RepID=A0A1U9NP45_9BACT|nr:hypothetical protein [Anaerohalosphaera lusitana]AQT69286.1 hypothetical protein STSP2_02475 [Anaerohalosphaera lusitana]